MSNDEKKVEKLLKEDIEQHEERNFPNQGMPFWKTNTFYFIIYLIVMYQLIVRAKILSSLNFIAEIIFNIFETSFPTHTILFMPSETFIALSSFLVVAGILFALFAILPYSFLVAKHERPGQVATRNIGIEVLIVIILIFGSIVLTKATLFIGVTTGMLDGNTETEIISSETTSFWENIQSGALCPLFNSIAECEVLQNGVEEDTKNQKKYSIKNKQSLSSEIERNEIMSEGFSVKYEFETGGETIIVNKVECYKGNTRENNLIGTTVYESPIKSNNKIEKTFKCIPDETFTLEEGIDEIDVSFALYISTETRIDGKIPIVNFEKYLEDNNLPQDTQSYEVQEDIIDKYGTGTFAPKNDAIDVDTEQSESFPIILEDGNDEDIEFDLFITNRGINKLGEIVESSFDEIIETQIIETTLKSNTPYNLNTFDDRSKIEMTFSKKSASIEEVFKNDEISFFITTQFKAKSSQEFSISEDIIS